MKIFSSWICIVLFATCSIYNLQAQSIDDSKLLLIKQRLLKTGHDNSDFQEMKISDNYHSVSLGLNHIYFQQYYLDIIVENAILNVGFKNNQLVQFKNSFAKKIKFPPNAISNLISAEKGLREALRNIELDKLPFPQQENVISNVRNIPAKYVFDKADISKNDISVSLIWVQDQGKIKLCWESIIEVKNSNNEWYHIQVDALTGKFFKKHNRILECTFDRPHQGCSNQHLNNLKDRDNTVLALANTYNVFDLPLESPNHGSRSLTSAPWDRAGLGNNATTLGWHNNGTSSFDITRGNNVFAYDDIAGNNTPGYSPSSVTLDFNYGLDFSLPPSSNIDAAITNLFHTSNLIHDIMYQYGFDEAAGNFQSDNLGRGGLGGDYVLAEALDGSGIDNANFSIVADGTSGRMQMFLWSEAPTPPEILVNTPITIGSPIDGAESIFSTANKLINVGSVTGNVILAIDNTGGTHEACLANPISNGAALSGNIALIDRGNCNFTEKALEAQNAGAIAVIVVNNDPVESPFNMGGEENTITIPAVMISFDDGTSIKNALLTETVNITLNGGPLITPDGNYDNGIIVHEYGHGISTRLTGGPSSPGCLQNDEQMGEGWSDFFALMMATDWTSATATEKRGIGTYVFGQPTSGTGIRTYPYSTDQAINPFTYADVENAPIIQGNVSPHYIGSIWATILWDMAWNIIDIEGASTDLYAGTNGNNIALQLVTDGLKLQPCSPGFVDGRDAILLADEIRYGGRYRCAIWDAFAGRGLGLSASQGSSGSYTDGVAAFDIPDEGIKLSSNISNVNAIEGEIITIESTGVCDCVAKNNAQVKAQIPSGYELVSVVEGSNIGNEVVSNSMNLNPLDTVRLSFQARVNLCIENPEVLQYSDDVEGVDVFTSSKVAGTGNIKWLNSSSQSNSSSTSWYAQDYASLADIALTINAPQAISGPTELSFYHKYETEDAFDGGIVEISKDGGSTWLGLEDNFVENGYPKHITTVGTDSRIIGQPAFTGNSSAQFGTSTFIRSTFNLSDFDGENILIRFRFVCDGGVGGTGINGWYIDDIAFTKVSGIIGKSFSYINNAVQDSSSRCVKVKGLSQNKIFIDEGASGSRYGGDWSNAFTSLQDAFSIAGCNVIDTILVAEGSYLPFNSRDSSFVLIPNMVVLGGFPTGGSSISNRNPSTNVSILSGNIGLSDTSDNVYHVIYNGAGINAIIDGVTIIDGNANGTGTNVEGSGIFNEGVLTLKNVTLQGNNGNTQMWNASNGMINISASTETKIQN